MKLRFRQSRRRFVKQVSAFAAAAASVGCAGVAPAARGPRVVIVGGGWGGAGAARALRTGGTPVAVTLIEPNPRFMSCPLSVKYIVGLATAESFQMGYEALARAGVNVVRERVQAIDRARRSVRTAAGEIGYDFLILAPGIEYIEEALPGYAQARDALPVGFRAFEQSAVKARFDEFLATGGTVVVSVPKLPYRCPPAPYERAALFAEAIKRRRVKGKVIVLDENPQPSPPPIARPLLAAFETLYKNEIEYRPSVELTGIDPARKIIRTTFGDVPYQMANLILPMRAPALIREAGLGQRWAEVRLPTFQSAADDRIYVIGDAAGVPFPKSGHVAFETGSLVAQHIGWRVRDASGPPPASAAPNAICYAFVAEKEAIGIHVASAWQAGGPPQLSFKVDQSPSSASAQAAMHWGRSIWQAMFG